MNYDGQVIQLQLNPQVEIMGYDGNEFVRLAGKAVFDVDKETALAKRDLCRKSHELKRNWEVLSALIMEQR